MLAHPKSFLTISPEIGQVQPTFTSTNLKGGDQVSITASRLNPALKVPFDPTTQSLNGYAFEPPNGTSKSVLDPIDFTATFGSGGKLPLVPLGRIDISGYGESLFSDWRDQTAKTDQVAKALFEVLVGRTSREIVKEYSVLYPYAVRVVRTITIERTNSGAVERHDSGWQATSDGTYAYPTIDLVTHPGIVTKVIKVNNIRDLNQIYTTPDTIGAKLMAVRFDCSVIIENCIVGQGADGVPALDQLGYVQLGDPKSEQQLTRGQYVELLAEKGPLGGIIDCTVNIGNSNLLMRVTRIGVGATGTDSNAEFAMAAWGAPLLPSGGQWSFIRQSVTDQAPQAVDRDNGIPLIRQGPSTAPPPPSFPYRFADPADLTTASPRGYYGILHSQGTQRVMFPSPKIEADGSHAISSVNKPYLADPFALGTATGPFPSLQTCIAFPDANYKLIIHPDGNLTFQMPNPGFTPSVTQRILRQSGSVSTIAYTEPATASVPTIVKVAIDTASTTPWSLNINNISLATESGDLGEVMRLVGTVSSTSTGPPMYKDLNFVFGKSLQPVADVVSFLKGFGPLPPLNVSMTNQNSLEVTDSFGLDDLIPPLKAILSEFVDDLDLKLEWDISGSGVSHSIGLEVTTKIPTPLGLIAVGVAKIAFKIADGGNSIEFKLGAGIGIGFKVGVFEAEAYYAMTQYLATVPNGFGIGAGMILKGEINLVIISVGLSVEAQIGLLREKCDSKAPGATTLFGVAQVTIAVEVHIFLLIDIEVGYQVEWVTNLDGGPCDNPS